MYTFNHIQEAAEEASSDLPKWALPEDNSGMLLFSGDVTSIRLAMSLERWFWAQQSAVVALKLIKLVASMVRAQGHSSTCIAAAMFCHLQFLICCSHYRHDVRERQSYMY